MITSKAAWRALLLASVLTAAGCALVPQDAVLTPAPVITKMVEGRGAPVGVEVVDERPSSVAGTRLMGNAAQRAGAEIKVADVASVVEAQIKDGLAKNEFTPVAASATADRKLKVEVRALELKTQANVFSASYIPTAAFKAVAQNKEAVFEKLYRVEFSRNTVTANTDGRNNRLLTEAVTKGLEDMLKDPELMGFLAR